MSGPGMSSSSSISDRKHQLYERTDVRSDNTLDAVTIKGIRIAGWIVETQRGSIADSKTIDECSSRWAIPLPEMPFDKNRLLLRHESSGWTYEFDAMQALRSVDGVEGKSRLMGMRTQKAKSSILGQRPTKSRRVKVAYADEWGKKREGQSASSPPSSSLSGSNFGSSVAAAAATESISTARDYDWTYSCTWPGAESSQPSRWTPGSDPARDRIPVERLGPPTTPGAKAEPILFYDDIVLFEDELGDNGCSMLGVKVRVMPSGFLVLQRFFLRVDNVVFRMFDTRMYVGFDNQISTRKEAMRTVDGATAAISDLSLGNSPMRVIRECSGCQAKYSEVKARLPPYKVNDLSPLTDAGWVSQQLAKIQQQQANHGAADMTRPAVLPSSVTIGEESNRILGEVVEDEDEWEGAGQWVDVVQLQNQ